MGTPLPPLSTQLVECQDCYKCLRNCPVKAIEVKDGHAMIRHEDCILCGNCFLVCPTGAKKVRDDFSRAKQLMQLKKNVIVSLAPSYISEFPKIKPEQIIWALKKLGFSAVSETALGAQQVSGAVAEMMETHLGTHNVLLSSACPVVVQLVKKYYPQYSDCITNIFSPVMAHIKLLKEKYAKEDAAFVFISPCLAKKWEVDSFPGMVDVAITFKDLREWFTLEGINPYSYEGEDEKFFPHEAREGALYPVDGGMIAGISKNCSVTDVNFMSFSGLETVRGVLDGLDELDKDKKYVIELLSCEGGCINGPLSEKRGRTALKRTQVIEQAGPVRDEFPEKPVVDVSANFPVEPVKVSDHNEEEIRRVLSGLGKHNTKDELNCGGCGYNTCRDLATAILDGRAEADMCVTYMKKQAQRKAQALLQTMPAGAVIVDAELKVIEANLKFAEFFDSTEVFEAVPGLEGAVLKQIFPDPEVFAEVLKTSVSITDKKFKFGDKVYLGTIFIIDKGKLAGGIFRDITSPVVQREQIIENAQKVLQKNLTTVQQIASLLGESASETEVTLNSIINSFDVHGITDVDGK